jgi:membrane-associated phospholipid phosphatase
MRNRQTKQSARKSNVVSPALLIGLLILGIALCGLSFFWDQAVIQWVKTHDLKTLKNFAGFLSSWGDWPELMLFGGIGLASAWWVRSRALCKLLLCMMIAATIAGAIVNSVRLVAGRARPNNTEATQEWNGLWRGREFLLFENKYHAFPSGHTCAAFAFFGVPIFARRWYGGCLLLIGVAIGWSRIYLNVHHFSDVTVGAFVGLVIAYLVWKLGAPWIDRNLGKFFVHRRDASA